jgi:TIR domain-containing protein
MALRVFVSHSAQEDQAVLDAIATAIGAHADLTLLMDTELLQPGDPWRARINLWLGACDAAVLVLSEKALASPWVVYETSVLSYRNRGGDFLIIPVLLGDPEGKLLGDRRLDAQQIKEVETIFGDDAATVAGKVVDRLRKAAEAGRPIDKVVEQFRVLLDAVPATLIEKAAAKLTLKLPWEPAQDRIRPLVEKLVGSSVPQAAAALYLLGTHFKDKPEEVHELIHLVAASWVNPKAVTQIPEVAAAVSGRAVALNAALQKTAQMYLIAASGGEKTWHFIPCGGDFPETPPQTTLPEEICAMVEKELRAFFNFPAGDLRAKLAMHTAVHTFLVALPSVGFTAEVIELLQSRFPSVTFFFLNGNQPPPAAAIERRLLTPITPDLVATEEATLHSNFQILEANVGEAQTWGTATP